MLILSVAIAVIALPSHLHEVSVLKPAKPPMTQIVILPHLDAAKTSRQKFIQKLSAPTDVLILSTNHFNVSDRNILYSSQKWTLASGEINKDATAVFSGEQSPEIIQSDHGIRNVLIDLAGQFNQANYHSFLIKDSVSPDELTNLEQKISDYCQAKNCLIVGSVDFSHYNPSSIAELHDIFAIKSLQKLDGAAIAKSETDSPNVLGLVSNLAGRNFLEKFTVYENSNTGKQSENPETETTSWVVGEYVAGPKTENESVQLMFAGDIMMDRLIDARFKDNFDNLFSDFKNRVFGGVDAAIANFEGPLNDGPVPRDVSVNNLIFNFPRNSAPSLKKINLSGFTLSNNHTLNDGSVGLRRTRNLLAEDGFFTFGSPDGLDELSSKTLDTTPKINLIGLNALNSFSNEELGRLISGAHERGEFVIVYPHWGNEYNSIHSSFQQNLAHEMIDSGADMIIGSHPHVVQDVERYKNKLIVYSLGNFVFDQTFSSETKRGLIAGINIGETMIKVSLVPVESVNLKPRIASGQTRQEVLQKALEKSFPNQLKSGIIELER